MVAVEGVDIVLAVVVSHDFRALGRPVPESVESTSAYNCCREQNVSNPWVERLDRGVEAYICCRQGKENIESLWEAARLD